MNHPNAIAIVRGFQAGVLCVMVGTMLGCASVDPESGSNERGQAVPRAAGSQEVVDCLLPGQIRQLDETVTYLTERRPVRTTKADCTGRGGAIQPSEGPAGSFPESGK
jgi:hypothetical protein